MIMRTPAQQTAMRYHCRLPEHTTNPRFYRIAGDLSVGLTLDSGYG
jgi:hypothetical protein